MIYFFGYFYNMPTKSILVVHEDVHVARLLCTVINNQNYLYHVASTFGEVEALLAKESIHLFLTDINIQGISRNEYVDYLKKQKESINVIVISSMDQDSMRTQSIKLGAKQFINLPVSVKDLQDSLTPYL